MALTTVSCVLLNRMNLTCIDNPREKADFSSQYSPMPLNVKTLPSIDLTCPPPYKKPTGGENYNLIKINVLSTIKATFVTVTDACETGGGLRYIYIGNS